MTNPKQITEQDIKFRVAKALFASDTSDDHVWAYISYSGFDPLNKPDELCRLLMDNWEGITARLDEWLYDYTDERGIFPDGDIDEFQWWENPVFRDNKELWILRALVAYKEGLK